MGKNIKRVSSKKNVMKYHVRKFLLVAGCLSLVACSNSNINDLQQYVKETKAKFKGKVEPLPAIVPYESYEYQVSEQRDPFVPSISLVKTITLKRAYTGLKPDDTRIKEELEEFVLKTLQMVGMMVKEGEEWAVVKAPDGTIYRVRKGSHIGERHGEIISISETRIEIKEIVEDGLGGWIERPNSLVLTQ